VHFRDLNKKIIIDDFPLWHGESIVDNTTGNYLLSFVNGYVGYHQVNMVEKDMLRSLHYLLGNVMLHNNPNQDIKMLG